MPKAHDLRGRRFGRLLVLDEAVRRRGLITWLCRCECGNEVEVVGDDLRHRSGGTQSCGCLRAELYRRPPMFDELGTHHGAECVEWVGHVSAYGYGTVNLRKGPGGKALVHRVAWERAYGPIPDSGDLVIDHVCNNRRCVNVDHLQLVTRGTNTRLGFGRAGGYDANQQCKNGHPWTGDNTYISPSGRRQCRACVAASQRRRQARLRSQT